MTISVLTQAREDLIERTVQSLVGVHHANIHLYNALGAAVPPGGLPRRQGRDQGHRRARHRAGDEVRRELPRHDGDRLRVLARRSSPAPSSPFSVEVCEAVSDVWQPEDGREIILNLPATVEMATPNVYADQIEWFSRQLTRREHTVI